MLLSLIIPVFLIRFAAGVEENARINCIPGKDEDSCLKLGCLWEVSSSDAPNCYLPETYGYRSYGELYNIENGVAIDLQRASDISMFGSDYDNITVAFIHQTNARLRVMIFTASEDRYKVPIKINEGGGASDPEYLYEMSNDPVFSFKIIRKSNGRIIFDTALGGLTFSDQFLQFSTALPSFNVYGFGEQEQPSFRHDLNWKTWSMFARDHAPEGSANLYGVHPHYTVLEEDGNAHGVLILNSNAQEVTFMPTPGLVYRTIGGILDLYFFLGPSPEDVVSQYTEAIGRYYVPPYWALGFHLCRWGYNSLENMMAAHQRTLDAEIPFDVQWGDIDYMDRVLDFTVNPVEFAELGNFVDNLHQTGMKFVPILDPCITTGEPTGSYPPFDEGSALDIWVKNSSGQPLTAKVWPADYCYFPDYSNPVTQDWWVNQLEVFHDKVAYDGIWIDMNEPANFVTGSVEGCPVNKWNNPPYKPSTDGDTLLEKTICMDAEQKFGRHYDVHSLFGYSESEPTLRGVQSATEKRGLVLSRSTFVGSGQWAAHWLGDNWSEWDNMHFSIIGVLQYNQFGYPLVGADICGFIGNSTEELCARWHQLGAFYPFSRNHNILGAIDQDPGFWEGGLVARVAKKAMDLRYALLPYFYSLFYKHTLQGSTVARPLWHEFTLDEQTWDIDTQFMLGPALLVAPVLTKGATSRSVYLPPASLWYNAYLGVQAQETRYINVKSDMSDDDPIPVYFRGGHILPSQYKMGGLNTVEMRSSKSFSMLVALDSNEEASGDLYLDDGESINPENLHTKILFNATKGMFVGEVEVNDYPAAEEEMYAGLWIMGVTAPVTTVSVNNDLITHFYYAADTAILTVFLTDAEYPLTQPLTVHWF